MVRASVTTSSPRCTLAIGAKASSAGSTDCISQPVDGIRLFDDSSRTPRELIASPDPS